MKGIKWRRLSSALLDAFDCPQPPPKALQTMGIFGYHSLRTPEDLTAQANISIAHAKHIVLTITSKHTGNVVKRVDRISEILCSVLDASELIRNVHPDQAWVNAASSAYELLHNYLNQLNTNQHIYNALLSISKDTHISNKLSIQEIKVASLLLLDFEKSGIHMTDGRRSKFVQLNDDIQRLGQQFSLAAFPSERAIHFINPKIELDGIPLNVINALVKESNSKSGMVIIPTSSDIANYILKMARNPETRRKVFLAMNSADENQINVLGSLLETRGELASLLGKESFAHMYLVDKMAKDPETVNIFLENLASANCQLAYDEIKSLQNIKTLDTGIDDTFYPWYYEFYFRDTLYYTQRLASCSLSKQTSLRGSGDSLSSYFTVGSTFQGLSDVFKSLYGISLEPETIHLGETWHNDVRKLAVVHESEGTFI
jgi:intermediate peptidase